MTAHVASSAACRPDRPSRSPCSGWLMTARLRDKHEGPDRGNSDPNRAG
jgi:hypothetical protein